MVQSLSNIPAYREFYARYLQSHSSMAFMDWCIKDGCADVLYQQIENYIETGNAFDNSNKNDLLSRDHSLSYGVSAMLQSQDEETYYEFDWLRGTFSTLTRDEAMEVLGIQGNVKYDTLQFGRNKVDVVDYVFGNLDDGQDSESYSIRSAKYGNVVNVVSQEFDIDYVLNAIYIDPSDPQYAIAKEVFDKLFDNAGLWLTSTEIETLTALKEEYGDCSPEYTTYLRDLILTKFDPEGEWDPNHNHVRQGYDISYNPIDDSTDGNIPDYDTSRVLQNTSFADKYASDQKWTGSKHYDNKTCEQSSADDARKQAEKLLTEYIDALIAELGDNCTQEMKDYMNLAKIAIISSNVDNYGESNMTGLASWFYGVQVSGNGVTQSALDDSGLDKVAKSINGVLSVETFGGGMLRDWGAKGHVSYKNLIDEFDKLFKNLCKNNGKTDEKAYEDIKQAYSSLYNMNFNSEAASAGIKNTYTVVNAQTANDFRDEAEEKILAPLRAQVKRQMAGKSISEAELENILNYASQCALADPAKWANCSNEFIYTIDTKKVIAIFEKAVHDAIKQKGY